LACPASKLVETGVGEGRSGSGGPKKWSLFKVHLSFVIFGCAFGAAFKKRLREAPPMTNDN
jgi:hypothetical protein